MTNDISRVLAKVQKLVALSASSQIEEARTSSYMACRLIREHDLQVVSCMEDPKPEPEHHEDQEPSLQYKSIRVKHKSYCRHCNHVIYPGEMALWCKGRGLLHYHCEKLYQQ